MGIRDERLYYYDSFLWEFDAVVVEVQACDGESQMEKSGQARVAGQWNVRLDKSAFYPTSGGQPNDVGFINDAVVSDVFVAGEVVYHTVDRPFQVGDSVHGRVDGVRRFDFMQQHCGQHILSRCFEDLMDASTIGFHLSGETVTVDLAVRELGWDAVHDVELRCNQVIWENRPISARFVEPEELDTLNLRSAPKVEKDIRTVSIEGFDDNACGGTHPRTTGQLGAIKVVKTESTKGGTRVTFVCGARAFADYQKKTTLLRGLGQSMSVGIDDIASTVDKLQTTLKESQKKISELNQIVAGFTAQEYVDKHLVHQGDAVELFVAVPNLSTMDELKGLMMSLRAILTEKGTDVGNGSNEADNAVGRIRVGLATEIGDRVHLQIVSTDPNWPANERVQHVMREFGGKGGGNSQTAQGSVAKDGKVTAESVIALLR